MMKLKKGLFLLCIATLLSIVGCSEEKAKDFRVANWGNTVDEVVLAENENGNENPEIDVDTNETTVTYSDITISGQIGDAEYIFVNEIDKPFISEYAYYKGGKKIIDELSKKDIPESRKKELNSKYDELIEKLQTEYDALPDTFVFDDFRLESAEYNFYDITEEASKQILVELKDKYGDPLTSEEDISSWGKDDTMIVYIPRDGYSYLRYSANFDKMEEYTKQNKGKGTKSDL